MNHSGMHVTSLLFI